MPTYDYECLICKDVFEQFQKMSDKPLETCPKCQGKVKRLVSKGAGFILKGSGFHDNDYRSSDYNKRAKSESTTVPVSCPNKDSKSCSGCGKV